MHTRTQAAYFTLHESNNTCNSLGYMRLMLSCNAPYARDCMGKLSMHALGMAQLYAAASIQIVIYN